ncbi:MAG: NAD(P)/FAD-dependent oxidoreductase [Halanaerobiales bacterium]
MKSDVLIIGGGVVGTAIAREFSKYELDVILLEKEEDIAMGTSKANSGIVHAGYNASMNTLKGRLNTWANPMFDQLCSDLQVPFERIGSLVVSFEEDDFKKLRWEKENGEKMGIKGLEIVDRDRLLELEPNINPEVSSALYAPTAGIVSSYEFTIALADSAVINGVNVMLGTEMTDLFIENNQVKGVETNRGRIYSSIVINAAGLFADEIASMAGNDIDITPRKGEYHLYDKNWGDYVNHVLFPIPSKISKGILVTPTVHGNLLIGPNSEAVAGKEDYTTTNEGLDIVFSAARKLVPGLERRDIITSFSGIRAVASTDDFVIGPSDKNVGLINVAGIQSPGLTSAPAIAEMVLEIAVEMSSEYSRELTLKSNFIEKDDFRERLPERCVYTDTEHSQWHDIIGENSDYGEIVCRCEHVTRGEIIDAIHRPVPATSVDAVKRRTRAGTGRCQGGFCGPRVVEILSEELKIPRTEVSKKGTGSEILFAKTKDYLLKEVGEESEKDYKL